LGKIFGVSFNLFHKGKIFIPIRIIRQNPYFKIGNFKKGMEFFNALIEIVSHEIQLGSELDKLLQQLIQRLVSVPQNNRFSQQISAHEITSLAAGRGFKISLDLLEFCFGQPDVQPPVSAVVFFFHDLFFFIVPVSFNLKVSLPASSEQRGSKIFGCDTTRHLADCRKVQSESFEKAFFSFF
jgi:hypothetical protein